MSKSHWIVPGPKERIGAVLRGCTVERLASSTDGAKPYKVAPSTHSTGARALHAVGLALATNQPTLCFLGPASAASGQMFEAKNSAVLTGAPVVFLTTYTELGDDTPVGRQTSFEPAAVAKAVGLATTKIKSTAKIVENAVKKACKAKAPTLIQASIEYNKY